MSLASSMRGGAGDVITKRLTLPGAVISSTAGGLLAVNASADSNLVQTGPASEWASFAARYQQYRVRALRLIMEPVFPGSGTPVGAAVVGHGPLYVSDYIGSSAPSTAAQVLSDERALVTNTSRKVDFTVDWARNPNAKLWNPTSAPPPTANTYGIAFAGHPSGPLTAATAYYTTTFEWVVEFRGSQ